MDLLGDSSDEVGKTRGVVEDGGRVVDEDEERNATALLWEQTRSVVEEDVVVSRRLTEKKAEAEAAKVLLAPVARIEQHAAYRRRHCSGSFLWPVARVPQQRSAERQAAEGHV